MNARLHPAHSRGSLRPAGSGGEEGIGPFKRKLRFGWALLAAAGAPAWWLHGASAAAGWLYGLIVAAVAAERLAAALMRAPAGERGKSALLRAGFRRFVGVALALGAGLALGLDGLWLVAGFAAAEGMFALLGLRALWRWSQEGVIGG
ncbi:MAG: hypothetical protein D6771_06270 [Zetaproteobacteria bacterium]|nr:MAG: hypothetical protein D6771_06270 [Zetaproteobacteria bacterium]